ncbi:MFS transporter permease [Microbacterium paludicola]|uniref:MFS transporter permease n=1 Tax=Microbacterium paludicola TaxID=300019 RepID=UPI0011A514F5|nr:MFS transporter permease [Microbacterium paludicola]
MWLRSAFYRWLFPAAVVLPLWLLIGWVVTGAGGWALLWVLFIAVPSVFVGQIVLTLLQRARPSARETRMASWWDVLGFGVWHALTIAIGFYPQTWFPLLLAGAIAVAIGLFWLQLWQLWSEARTAGGGIRFMRAPMVDAESGPSRATPVVDDVFVIKEKPTSEH